MRIVIGRKPLTTTVRLLPKAGIWELEAVVPSLDADISMSNTVVPIVAQALTETNGLLDAVTVGPFTYWSRKLYPISLLPRLIFG